MSGPNNQYRTVTVGIELSNYVAQGWEIVPSSAHTVVPPEWSSQPVETRVVVWRPNPLFAPEEGPASDDLNLAEHTARGPQFPTPEELADLLEGC